MNYNIKVKMGNEQKPKSLATELAKIKEHHGSLKTDHESLLQIDVAYRMARTLYALDYLAEPEYAAFLKRLEARIEHHLNKLNKDFSYKIEFVI